MIPNRAILFFTAVILLTGCKQEGNTSSKATRKLSYTPTLINFGRCFTDFENELSFPVWYNDSLIISRRIKKIERIYKVPSDDADSSDVKFKKIYFFDKSGEIKEMQIEEYYENSLISNSKFKYLKTKDEYGYCEIKRINSSIDFGDQYKIYKPVYFSDYLTYTEKGMDDVNYYIPERKFWKVLKVDSLIAPGSNDRINYGTPNKIFRSFKIKNKVEESEILEFEYDETQQILVAISMDNYPFYTMRRFNFGEKDKCTGYIDSLFSGENCLNSIRTSITYQNQVLPVMIFHRHLNQKGELLYTETEQFNYEYYN